MYQSNVKNISDKLTGSDFAICAYVCSLWTPDIYKFEGGKEKTQTIFLLNFKDSQK